MGGGLAGGLGLRLMLQLPGDLAVDIIQGPALLHADALADDAADYGQRQARIPQTRYNDRQQQARQRTKPDAQLLAVAPDGVVGTFFLPEVRHSLQLRQAHTDPQQRQRRQRDEDVPHVVVDEVQNSLHSVLLCVCIGGADEKTLPSLHWDESVKHFVVPPKFGLAALFAPVTGSAPWMFPSPLTRCLHLCLAAVRFQPMAHLSCSGGVQATPARSARLSLIVCDLPMVVKP